MFVPSRKACQELGIHANTLRRWADEGKIRYVRSPSNQRLYDVSSVLRAAEQRRQILYARVSSRKQRDDLIGQVRELRERFPHHELIEDFGSGLNFKRKGFTALLESIMRGDVSEVVVAHRDRLCRFGFELFQRVADFHDCRILVLNDTSLSPQAELVADLLSILHVFSCRLYGLRKYCRQIREDPNLSKEGESGPDEAVSGTDETLVQHSD